MKRFSAHYVFTGHSLLKRAVVNTTDDGTVISVEDTGGDLRESAAIEFYNGIIVPGFVNCHCHLELSAMKGVIEKGTGLGMFLNSVNKLRNPSDRKAETEIASADSVMAGQGVVLCADICNRADTFPLKKKSEIKYISLLEVFGVDPSKAGRRTDELKELISKAAEAGIDFQVVPHSVYSVSPPLFSFLKNFTSENRVTSIHFLESEDERDFIEKGAGPIMDSYRSFPGITPDITSMKNHTRTVLEEITRSGNLLLVHCTTAQKEDVIALKQRKNLYYCLCPNSNLYITGKLPPVNLLTEEGCNIVLGTDSLSSNENLNILSEMYTLQENFSFLKFEDILRWATLNGATALGQDSWAGSTDPGKKPGLVLIENADLQSLRLTPFATSRRLI